MTAVKLDGLGVTLDGRKILEDFDLEIEPGSMVGLVGPNGAGKTTVLRAIAGAVPSGGAVRVGGRIAGPHDRSGWARLVALVPQRPELPPDMRVIDYVLLGRTPHLRYLAMEGASDVEIVERALRSLDLTGLADRRLGELSGGEQQRAVLARSLAQASPVLLLDEPTAALDVGHAVNVFGLVDDMRRARGLTVIAALHDLTLAAQFCDRLVMVAEGRIVAQGEPHDVLTEPIIRAHYGAVVRVLDDGAGGVVVIPVRDSHHSTEAATMVERP